MASFLWAYVETENYYDSAFEVPVKMVDVDEGLVVENDITPKIRVRFRAKGKMLFSLGITHDFEIVISLAGRDEGTHSIELSEENVVVGRNSERVQVLEPLIPNEIQIVLAKLLSKHIPIVPQVQISTLNGYELIGAVQVDPESVVVSGPQRLVNELREWHTEKKAVAKVQRDVRAKVALADCTDTKLRLNRQEVNVFADIQKLMERRFEDVPVIVRNIPAGWSATVVPAEMSLTLEGGVDIVTTVQKEQIFAYIDWEKIKPGKTEYPAYIERPEPELVRIRDVSPQHFKVIRERR